MPITRRRLGAPLRLGVVMGVAFLGVAAIPLLSVGLELVIGAGHHSARWRA
jgi:hypothetical protein